MAETVISVKDVVKQYKVRHEKGRTLKEAFLRQRTYSETINALNHVSFDVKRGSAVGVIGSNGSGKSTLLKLIAGTSRPNEGDVTVSGRVSALLQLAAGFHPDFTGRENVFLDGIILGLTTKEINERFDDIVDFAEMREFIDAPAKTYSSGMYMRLAFSVAASVDPEVLLIDEVLAVGDQSFQRKCHSRIDEIRGKGTTILFVSHSMAAVRELCDEVIWLDKGTIRAQGPTEKVIHQYMKTVYQRDNKRFKEDAAKAKEERKESNERWGSGKAEITDFELVNADGEEMHLFNTGDYMKMRISYKANEKVEKPILVLVVTTMDNTVCLGTSTRTLGKGPASLPDSGVVEFEFDQLPFLPGHYSITAALQQLGGEEVFDYHDRRFLFEVVEGVKFESGICHAPYRWLNWPAGK